MPSGKTFKDISLYKFKYQVCKTPQNNDLYRIYGSVQVLHQQVGGGGLKQNADTTDVGDGRIELFKTYTYSPTTRPEQQWKK